MRQIHLDFIYLITISDQWDSMNIFLLYPQDRDSWLTPACLTFYMAENLGNPENKPHIVDSMYPVLPKSDIWAE